MVQNIETLTVLLEYIDHLFFFINAYKCISYYAGIMLNAFSDPYYAGIIGGFLAKIIMRIPANVVSYIVLYVAR